MESDPTRIEVFLSTEPGERILGERLVGLLREWVAHTPHGEDLVDVVSSPRGDEAVARLREEERVLEVRAHHEGGPDSHRLWIETRTWVRPNLPAPGYFWAIGAVVAAGGIAITLLVLGSWAGPLILGLVGSVLLAILVGHLAWQGAIAQRIRSATDASGGQGPAVQFLEQLGAVIQKDQRVTGMREA